MSEDELRELLKRTVYRHHDYNKCGDFDFNIYSDVNLYNILDDIVSRIEDLEK